MSLEDDLMRAAELVSKHGGKIADFVYRRDDGVIVGRGWTFEEAKARAAELGIDAVFEEVA